MAITWRIELFGRLSARCLGEGCFGAQSIDRLSSRREGALLAFLARFPRPHARDELVEVLWPEHDPQLSRRHLRVVLCSLRHALEPPGVPSGSILMASRGFIGPDAVTTDVAEFEAALQAASRATSREGQRAQLTQAVELYGGALLPGCYEEWIVPEAQRLEEMFFTALRRLVLGLEKSQPARALQFAQRGASLSPLHEDIGRDLMRLYAATGQTALALRQYHEMERALHRQWNVVPSPQTRELLRAIERDARPPLAPQLVPPERLAEATTATQAASPVNAALVVPPVAPKASADTTRPAQVGISGRLPPQWTRFFGRVDELAQLQQRLADGTTRLVTLTGAGGSGKTRLAVEVACLLAEEERTHGALWFVPLATLAEVPLVEGAIADAMRLPRIPQMAPLAQLVPALAAHERPVLVLDNFEHLLPVGAALVQELLARVPRLRIIVTSRRELQIVGEHLFDVPPMRIPALGLSPEHLLHVDSVQLFHDRARAARPGFRITRHNVLAIAQLCARLEGLPLAIELCAARAGAFSPAKMLARLDRRLDFLAEPAPGSTYQHPTLSAALEWSHALLWPEMQSFFAQMCAFHGGCTPEAAASITGEEQAAHLLHQLRVASLARSEERNGKTRFFLLEAVREFACQKLPTEEHSALRQRHAAFYGALAASAEPHLSGPGQCEWLSRLDAETDNLRAALEWAAQSDGALFGRMASALGRFWLVRGHYAEGSSWIRGALLQSSTEISASEQRKMLGMEAELSWYGGDFAQALAINERRLAEAQEAADARAQAEAARGLGYAAAQMGDFERARPLFEQSLALSRGLGDDELLCQVLHDATSEASAKGDYARARALGEEGTLLSRRLGDTRQTALLLNIMGFAATLEGDLARARPLLEESLLLSEAVGEKWHTNRAWWTLGHQARLEGDLASARSIFDHALRELRDWGYLWPLPYHLEPRAYMDIAEGKHQKAALLLGAAEALRTVMRHALHPSLRPEHERHLALLRASLDASTCAAAQDAGRALTMEQAVALALGEG